MRQLLLLHDVLKQGLPDVRLVTLINKICSSIKENNGDTKDMLPSVHKLLHLTFKISVTSATAELTFSDLKRLNN